MTVANNISTVSLVRLAGKFASRHHAVSTGLVVTALVSTAMAVSLLDITASFERVINSAQYDAKNRLRDGLAEGRYRVKNNTICLHAKPFFTAKCLPVNINASTAVSVVSAQGSKLPDENGFDGVFTTYGTGGVCFQPYRTTTQTCLKVRDDDHGKAPESDQTPLQHLPTPHRQLHRNQQEPFSQKPRPN
ncbi:MAG: hypothetical protein AB7H77_07710 [Bdellovibrionales bacterium]